jgi:organic hydroperoxide reductase OsmC/OhrA
MNDTAHTFDVTAAFRPGEREGTLESGSKSFSIPFSGAPALGGKEGLANPEELLLASLGACFTQTWAIFLGKLKLPITDPVVDLRGELTADPAGGFRMSTLRLEPRVPADLWEARRGEVEKSLHLAEKYCIVSRAVRGDGSVLKVEVKTT